MQLYYESELKWTYPSPLSYFQFEIGFTPSFTWGSGDSRGAGGGWEGVDLTTLPAWYRRSTAYVLTNDVSFIVVMENI